MKKNSILFTVNITFLIAFTLISIGFAALYDMHEKREEFFIHKRGTDMARMFLQEYMREGMNPHLKDELKHFNFTLIDNREEIRRIMDDERLHIRHIRDRRHLKVYDMEYGGHALTFIKSPRFQIILEDNSPIQKNFEVAIVIYLVILGIFGFLYFSIINKLKPLKKLNEVVQNIGNEKFDVDLGSDHKDEISTLMNEFTIAARKLKRIKESRNIFIRNIMHELKTPIAKGKFLLYLPQSDENNEKMEKVFYRLEALIKEFATIEELIATKKHLETKEYFLEDIIDNSVDILMCNEEEVQKEFQNIKFKVDFDIFSIAVKNLLDNAIKYSNEKLVTVKTENTKVVFENSGKGLKYPLEDYFEPFFRGDDVKSNQSFGLGLYIIKHILEAHGMELEYEYKNGVNRFMIVSQEQV